MVNGHCSTAQDDRRLCPLETQVAQPERRKNDLKNGHCNGETRIRGCCRMVSTGSGNEQGASRDFLVVGQGSALYWMAKTDVSHISVMAAVAAITGTVPRWRLQGAWGCVGRSNGSFEARAIEPEKQGSNPLERAPVSLITRLICIEHPWLFYLLKVLTNLLLHVRIANRQDVPRRNVVHSSDHLHLHRR